MAFFEVGMLIGGEALLADAAFTGALEVAADGAFATAGSDAAFTAALETAGSSATGSGLVDALGNAVIKNAAGQFINAATGALITGAGGVFQAGTAAAAAAKQAAAAKEAAGVLAPAQLEAAKLQADAAAAAGHNIAGAASVAGNTIADNAKLNAGALSTAATGAASTLAGGYTTAAAQKVSGLNDALGTAKDVIGEQRTNQKPYMTAGTEALDTLTAGLKPGGAFNKPFTMADAQNMPAYTFALEQGKETIGNAAAAGGLQLSSANIQSLGKFAEGTAAQYEQQAFTQWLAQKGLTLGALQQMVNSGQTSVGQLQGALAQYGVSAETIQTAIGSANAAGTLGAAGATATGIRDAANATATGNTTAAHALATATQQNVAAEQAGKVGSAGYTASGITGAANATASGITGSANANAAGTVAVGNAIGNTLSNVGNQLNTADILNTGFKPTTTQTAQTSPMQPQYPMSSGVNNSAGNDYVLQGPSYA